MTYTLIGSYISALFVPILNSKKIPGNDTALPRIWPYFQENTLHNNKAPLRPGALS